MRGHAKEKIALVVEDEWIIRADIVSEFESRQWKVIEASNGEAAIEAVRDAHVDIVVTDVELGKGMSGWDVAERLRSEFPALQVVYTSGVSLKYGRCVSGAVFFAKPYDARQIVATCDRLVDAGSSPDH